MKLSSLALALLLSLTACLSSPKEEISNFYPAESLNKQLPATPYPPKYTMNQQIILTMRDKEYDFIGYLAVEGPTEFRALAFAEIGGKVFDLVFTNGNVDILKKPEKIPLNPLIEGVAGDIEHIYMPPHYMSGQKQRSNNGNIKVILKNGKDMQTEYLYSPKMELLLSTKFSKNKAVREVGYSNYRLFSGWEKPLPAKILIINHRWHYQIEVNLLKIRVHGLTKEDSKKGARPDDS